MGSWKTSHQCRRAVAVLDAGILRLDPFRGHGRRRPAVVGPDLEAVVNPLPGAGRDASAIEQDRDDQAGQREPSRNGEVEEFGERHARGNVASSCVISVV